MTQATDAMKLASKEGISLKEAWARVKGELPPSSPLSVPKTFDNPDTTEEREYLKAQGFYLPPRPGEKEESEGW